MVEGEPRIRRKKNIKVRVLDMPGGVGGRQQKRTNLPKETDVKEKVTERSLAGQGGRGPIKEDLQCQASSLCLKAT